MTRLISSINKNRLLTISIGIIYLWFGTLKFFPELSPADALAKQTISFLTIGVLPEMISILILAIIEVTVGLCLIFNFQLKKVIAVAIIHLLLTFIPVLVFPETSFSKSPFVLTLVGQYILKNIVIISALFLIYPLENYKVDIK